MWSAPHGCCAGQCRALGCPYNCTTQCHCWWYMVPWMMGTAALSCEGWWPPTCCLLKSLLRGYPIHTVKHVSKLVVGGKQLPVRGEEIPQVALVQHQPLCASFMKCTRQLAHLCLTVHYRGSATPHHRLTTSCAAACVLWGVARLSPWGVSCPLQRLQHYNLPKVNLPQAVALLQSLCL